MLYARVKKNELNNLVIEVTGTYQEHEISPGDLDLDAGILKVTNPNTSGLTAGSCYELPRKANAGTASQGGDIELLADLRSFPPVQCPVDPDVVRLVGDGDLTITIVDPRKVSTEIPQESISVAID